MKDRLRSLFAGALILLLSMFLAATTSAKTLQVALAISEIKPFYEQVIRPQFVALHPDVDVEFQYLGWGVDKFVTAYAGGNPPDVLQIGGDKLGSYLGMISSLNPFVKNWKGLTEIPPPILESANVDNELYGVPWQFATRALQYRMDWFSEAGLNPAQPPQDWDDLVVFGRKLVRFDNDGNMTRQGYYGHHDYIGFSPLLFQAGGDWMSEDLTRTTYGEKPGIEALDFLHSLFHEHRISDATRKLGGIEKGESAIAFSSPYFVPESKCPNWQDIAVALPLTHRAQFQISLPSLWVITNTSPLQQEAWKWIEHDLSLELVLEKHRAFGGIAPLRSVLRYSPWNEDPRWQILYQGLTLSKTVPQGSPYYDLIRREYAQPAIQRVLFEGEPLAILEESMRQANAWLSGKLTSP